MQEIKRIDFFENLLELEKVRSEMGHFYDYSFYIIIFITKPLKTIFFIINTKLE